MSPRFFIQKMDANALEKKMPLTAANATRCSANVDSWSEIQLSPLRLVLDTRNCVNGIEEILVLGWVLDV